MLFIRKKLTRKLNFCIKHTCIMPFVYFCRKFADLMAAEALLLLILIGGPLLFGSQEYLSFSMVRSSLKDLLYFTRPNYD